MHVLIAGAGLGGLALAQILRKNGISYEIFERDPDPNARPQGWAIALHSIIDHLLSVFPDDMPDLRAATNNTSPLDLQTEIAMYPAGRDTKNRIGYLDTPEHPIIRAERRRLRTWLCTNIPVSWGRRVVRVEQDDIGVTVHFEDGASATGDILVGADGTHSRVREELLQKPSSELLKVVPLAIVVGELKLSGDALRRQLALGHNAYICPRPDLGFYSFAGPHYVEADGLSARYYWNLIEWDHETATAGHWLQTATAREKLDYVLKRTASLPAELREIYPMTPLEGIKSDLHILRDLQLPDLPAGRVVLMGDAAHAMAPLRGEGGYHTFLDSFLLGKMLCDLEVSGDYRNITGVRQAVNGYNDEMLKRGRQATQDSRDQHGDQTRFGPDGKPLVYDVQPLPNVPIVLGNKT